MDARTVPRQSAHLDDASPLDVLELAAGRARTRHSLALYYRALCGEVCSLVPYDDGSSPWEHADTETTVWLPARAPLDDHAEFTADEWYQVAMTHRAMHRRLGTFELDLDRAEPLYHRLRPADSGAASAPALERLAGLFGHAVLGVHVFATCEDLRIDAATDVLYPGLARAATGVRHGALHERPQPATLSPRAGAVEALVRFSLGGTLVVAATALEPAIARIIAAARPLRDPRATVESSVEAALRICHTLIELPTTGEHRATHEVRFASLDGVAEAVGPEQIATLPDRMAGAEGFAGWYVPVEYRDWPGPRYVGEPASDLSLAAFLPRIAQRSTAPDPSADADPADADPGADEDAGHPPRRSEPSGPARRDDLPVDALATLRLPGRQGVASGDPLRAGAPNEVTYPEWDHIARRLLLDHTLVRVRAAPADPSDHHHLRALARYGHLVTRLVRSLERISPQGTIATRRVAHGDDLDLDACVDAMIDLRLGAEPNEQIFTDLRRGRREVAVAFALDLSASTGVVLPPDPEAPGTVRRVLDLQRDAVSLVAEALDRIGDDFGIYGFSGSGRDDVRLSVVKDVEERLTRVVWHRLGGLRPDHTTRLGAAVRHLAHRLAEVDAATKILIVTSDGRPYDVDYGEQYGEDAGLDYAVADTAHALHEARALGVSPYLVTVDPDGDDYLRPACDPRDYHVIAEANDLPRALADIYLSIRRTHHPA